jgi:hypothetical protein
MTLVNVDDMFNEWAKATKEMRRVLQGKYYKNTDIILGNYCKIYDGPKICDRKFNFTVLGNKCTECNSLSFLTRDGTIPINEPILIQTGIYKGQSIEIKSYSRLEKGDSFEVTSYNPELLKQIFAKIPLVPDVLSYISPQTVHKCLCNNGDENFHIIGASILLNYLFEDYEGFKNRFLYTYMCDNLKLVYKHPDSGIGSFKKLIQNSVVPEDVVLGIVQQLVYYFHHLYINDAFFNHGSPSLAFLSFSSDKTSVKTKIYKKKVSVTFPVTLAIEPGKYTSFNYINYFPEKSYRIVPRRMLTSSRISEVFISFKYVLNSSNFKAPEKLENSCLSEYLSKREIQYSITPELIEFGRSTGLSMFPTCDLYLFLIACLTEKPFYDSFIKIERCLNLLKLLFGKSSENLCKELEKIHLQGITMNSDELISFVSNLKYEYIPNCLKKAFILMLV